MSMMVNPSGSGQVVATGQPFTLRLPRKKAAPPPDEAAGTDGTDGTDEPGEELDDART